MLINFFSALALVFVFEGLMPFAYPKRWKAMMFKMVGQKEKMLRFFGFFSMMVGLLLLSIIHQFAE